MPGLRRAPVFASDEWMLEQQLRAEMEAQAWRRLRDEMAQPPPEALALPAPAPEADDIHTSGSIILKALVRFILGAFGAYLAYLAAIDSQLGQFEVWLAIGASFLITLALSLFDPLRRLVHMLAETARWALILGFCLGALWLVFNHGQSL